LLKLPWRRIFWIQLWLTTLPPLGMWMLWKDTQIPPAVKPRVLVYTYLIPILVYVAMAVFVFNSAQKAIEAGGSTF
jgi:hypothetical protein